MTEPAARPPYGRGDASAVRTKAEKPLSAVVASSVTEPLPTEGTWGACRFCGVAVPAGASRCPMCGAADPIPAAGLASAPRRVRRRVQLTGFLRSVIVIAVVAGLAYTLVATVLAGPPNVADPLTTTGTYAIGPGNYTVISGDITGGDYVIGNWTSVAPPGMNVGVVVYNSSNWAWFTTGSGVPGSQWNNTPTYSGEIVFSALYTDTYYFVFSNPLPTSTHLTIAVYVATEYYSNSANDGFD